VTEIVVIGGGGHAKVLIGVLRKLDRTVLGYTDRCDRGMLLGVAHLGEDDALPAVAVAHPGCGALVGVGKVDAAPLRLSLQQDAAAIGFDVPVVVSPDAVVNEDVRFGDGTMVFDGVVVNSGAATGRACILNTHATIEHDCILGDDVHVAPGATVSGGVRIGDHCMIGAGATITHGVSICAGCVIGAGAVVVGDIAEPGIYAGCPARRLR
jgi:sugar O-acyltransferase (sialic acid O-acetyltransferase NeuD family)